MMFRLLPSIVVVVIGSSSCCCSAIRHHNNNHRFQHTNNQIVRKWKSSQPSLSLLSPSRSPLLSQSWKSIPRGGGENDDSSSSKDDDVVIPTVEATTDNNDATIEEESSTAATETTETETETLTETETGGRSGGATMFAAASKSSSSLSSSLAMLATIVCTATKDLKGYMKGPKTDALLLLSITAMNTPLCRLLGGLSPILGFLVLGVVLGPYGYNAIADIHTTELLADLGVVLFLFEMGIHLNFATLMKMKRTVFGLGGCQMVLTTLAFFAIGTKVLGRQAGASLIVAGGLALSSSAFVLQLLKDKNQLSSRFGTNSFGVLLLQDLAVVPLLVVTPLLAGGGGGGDGMKTAIVSALVKAVMALGIIGAIGSTVLVPLFEFVVKSSSQDSLIGFLLSVILGMSFLTEGLGLSNTLGAFLAGVLLSDTNAKHDHNIEKEISPFRGILVGLFFFTVGFEIDAAFVAANWQKVAAMVSSILVIKCAIITALCFAAFGLPFSISQRCGFLLGQGGEFAFVAFRLARSHGILDKETTKLLLTCVSLTMAVTPFLETLGGRFAVRIEEKAKNDIDAIAATIDINKDDGGRNNNNRQQRVTREKKYS